MNRGEFHLTRPKKMHELTKVSVGGLAGYLEFSLDSTNRASVWKS